MIDFYCSLYIFLSSNWFPDLVKPGFHIIMIEMMLAKSAIFFVGFFSMICEKEVVIYKGF